MYNTEARGGEGAQIVLISTKGRYALRMMLEFAMHPQECTKISQVAQRQQISVKYLEQIVTVLCKAGYVKSMRGAQGGYRLSRDAADYTVGETGGIHGRHDSPPDRRQPFSGCLFRR